MEFKHKPSNFKGIEWEAPWAYVHARVRNLEGLANGPRDGIVINLFSHRCVPPCKVIAHILCVNARQLT